MASDHQYALTSVLFTNDYRQVMRASNGIEAGELYINRSSTLLGPAPLGYRATKALPEPVGKCAGARKPQQIGQLG